jgi:hypothetical protein
MKSIKTSVFHVSLIEEGIIHVIINDHADFDINVMLEMRAANNELSGGKPYCVLLESGDFVNYTKEAQRESTTPEHTKNRIAMAVIENNIAIRILTDFYIKLFKPIGPTKSFKSKEKAMEWLRERRDRNKS